MSWRLLGVFAGLCAGLGCASFGDPMGRAYALEEAQLSYTQSVRWGNLQAASELVDPPMREAFLAQRPAFERIRITEYDIGKIDYDPELMSAKVNVTYHGYSLATLEERRIEETQRWERTDGSTWWVKPQLAGLIDAFPEATR
jgi:hypothetical protein